jgi:hypothetical protein
MGEHESCSAAVLAVTSHFVDFDVTTMQCSHVVDFASGRLNISPNRASFNGAWWDIPNRFPTLCEIRPEVF